MTRQEFEAWATAHGWTKDQWGHYHKGDRRFKLSKVAVRLEAQAGGTGLLRYGCRMMEEQMNRLITPAPFRVFVYGTLKRGFSNHEYFCRGVTAIEEAVICGRLYALNAHIPALAIPETSILAHGSLDYADDHRRQRDVVVDREQPASTDAWRMIHGEVLTFTEPERLARLDQLEGFRPPGLCLYHRVLAPVRLQGDEWLAAWVYTIGERVRGPRVPLDADVWEDGSVART